MTLCSHELLGKKIIKMICLAKDLAKTLCEMFFSYEKCKMQESTILM